jgi:hypothetical protein
MLLANGIQWEGELLAKVSRPYVGRPKPAKVCLHRRLDFKRHFLFFRNSRYCSSHVAKFRDHTLQDDKIMVF